MGLLGAEARGVGFLFGFKDPSSVASTSLQENESPKWNPLSLEDPIEGEAKPSPNWFGRSG